MVCGACGRILKDPESVQRGFGPVCYRKIMPPVPRKAKTVQGSKVNHGPLEDFDYTIPGQMELSDFLEMMENGGTGSD